MAQKRRLQIVGDAFGKEAKQFRSPGRMDLKSFISKWGPLMYIYTDLMVDENLNPLEKNGAIYISDKNIDATQKKELTPFKKKLRLLDVRRKCYKPTFPKWIIQLLSFKPGLDYEVEQISKHLIRIHKKTYVLQQL